MQWQAQHEAQVSFVKGEAELSYTGIVDEPDVSFIDGKVSAAFSMNTFGFQIGAGSETIRVPGDSFTSSKSDVRVYQQTGNGSKYGAYYATGGILMFSSTSYGVEGMFSIAGLDVEAYAGIMTFSSGPDDIGQAGLGVYYDVSQGIGLSINYDTLFETDGGSETYDVFSFGASYAIPNTNLRATASYQDLENGAEQAYSVGIQWNFGPNQGERLFGDRGMSFLFLGA